MKKLIAAALIVCATVAVVAVAIVRHVNNTQDALWCHEHGYANYAARDGFCVEHAENSSKLVSSSCAGGVPLDCGSRSAAELRGPSLRLKRRSRLLHR
jgi:uncharacterized low-complexity protein